MDWIDQMQTRLEALTVQLAGERERAAELAKRLADAYASGDDEVDTLAEDQARVAAKVQGLADAVDELERRTVDAKAEAILNAARARVTKIAQILSSNTYEQQRRIARLKVHADGFISEAEKINAAYLNQWEVLDELGALLARWPDELQNPEPDLMAPPGRDDEIEEIHAAVRAVAFNERSPGRFRRKRVPRGSPGFEILERAGPSEAEIREQEEAERASGNGTPRPGDRWQRWTAKWSGRKRETVECYKGRQFRLWGQVYVTERLVGSVNGKEQGYGTHDHRAEDPPVLLTKPGRQVRSMPDPGRGARKGP